MVVLQIACENLIISLKIYVFQPKVLGTLLNPVVQSLHNINAFLKSEITEQEICWNFFEREVLMKTTTIT